ncbi:MAG: ATP-binding protein, partial [bacterium]|nr:ATP-binding protein [bacterium]
MSSVLNLNSIADTTLWKILNSKYQGTPEQDTAAILAANAQVIAEKAVARIKAFPYFHPQYTLHDETHLLRVCELMAIVAGDSLLMLNPIEIFLLIGAAFYHDQGMVPDADEWIEVQASTEFQLSLKRWAIDNPNMSQIKRQISDSRVSGSKRVELRKKENELLEAHRTEFLRKSHGERSEAIVNRLYSDSDTLSISGHNLATILGRLCVSHVLPASQLSDDLGFRLDEGIGTFKVNTRYLALLLRLADILDFDRDRTPSVLLRTIHFSSPISLVEWSKHLSVAGWEIGATRIRYTLKCEHPSYERAAYEFMDWIDHELGEAARITAAFPKSVPSHYSINLPAKVDRSRIEPKNNAYRFADLEFVLSREEIVNLLMTDKLYRDNSLFLRELLQNSLDALRHRDALFGQQAPQWDEGLVTLVHFVNEDGFQVVKCTDNGVGMDEDQISRYLVNVGRSYYRSPEFEQQRIGFLEKGVDFDPCAKFGIGFMSCFMFGDQIRIATRRDYGPGRNYGDPLVIEINGLGGMLVIREGRSNQPIGTTVEVIGPQKPPFLDAWTDRVLLCHVVGGYALATEYRIEAETTIEEIQDAISVPSTPAVPHTVLDNISTNKIELEQSFNEIDGNLRGTIRTALLVNSESIPTIDNGDVRYAVYPSSGADKQIKLESKDESIDVSMYSRRNSPICMDGILVTGQPGRNHDDTLRLGYTFSSVQLGDAFVLDIRGNLKPTLTPARTPPPRNSSDPDQSWKRIERLVHLAHSRLWENVASYLSQGLSHEEFWILCRLHSVKVHLMSAKVIWGCVSMPAMDADGEISYRPLQSLENFEIKNGHPVIEGIGRIAFDDAVNKWTRQDLDANWMAEHILYRFSEVEIRDGQLVFQIVNPNNLSETSIKESFFGGRFKSILELPIRHAGQPQVIAAECGLNLANRNHPIVK